MIRHYMNLSEERSLTVKGITFNNLEPALIDYTIRTAALSLPPLKEEFASSEYCREENYLGCPAAKYRDCGFLELQTLINTALSRVMGNVTNLKLPSVSIQLLPKFQFKPSIAALRGLTAIILVFSYSPLINFLLVNLVAEKEKKIRETMRIMGTLDAAYWFSWSIIYGVIVTIVTLVCTVIIKVTGILPKCDGIILFFLLLFYGITIMHLAFAMMPLFKKANVAGTVGTMATLLVGLLYLPINITSTTGLTGIPETSISIAWQWVLCLLSPIALGLAVDKAQLLEVTHGGLHYNTITVGEFPVYGSLVMLIIDCFLYALIAWYLERIVPGEFGPRQSAFFCFSKNYWMPRKKPHDNMESDHLVTNAHGSSTAAVVHNPRSDVEDVSPELKGKEMVRIFSASKKFKKTIAVDNLSLDIYEGQITCLLGHNGAGKTTLVNMLTGVMHPSSGSATVYGYDVSDPNEVALMRSMIGMCPQENCLFDSLSCVEHLEVYASIKGVLAKDIKEKVLNALDDVGLGDKADAFAKDLSGGQKRKLSVAIALIGDPKVVFLDEPSAGLDPSSRRHLWSLLKSFKKDRVIVMTTHFMDEADLLADRKAFISKGKLKCCGSSLFLKNRFGIGYHLTMVIDNDANVSRITEEVSSHVERAKFVRRFGQELMFTLPFHDVGSFAGLFSKFESSVGNDQVDFSTTLGIQSYGVSMTSLEEVFMKLEEAEEMTDHPEDGTSHLKDIIIDVHRVRPEVKFTDKHSENQNLLESNPAVIGDKWGGIEMKPMGKRPTMPKFDEDKTNSQFDRLYALGRLRGLQMWRNKKNIFYRILLPVFFILLGAVFPKFIKTADPASDLVHHIEPHVYVKNPRDRSLPPLMYQNFTGRNIDGIVTGIRNQSLGIKMVDNDANFSSIAPHHIGLSVWDFKGEVDGFYMNYTGLYNDTMVHSLPTMIAIVSNAIYQLVTNESSWKIETSAMMWPDLRTVRTYRYRGGTLMTVLLWGMAMVIIPPGFTGEVAQDRVTKARSQLRISGVRLGTYWLTYFLTHLSQFCVCALLTIAIALIIQADSLKSPGAMICLVLLYIIYMPTLTLLAYILSFPFKRHETALTVVSNLFLVCAVIPFFLVMTLVLTEAGATTVHIILCFIDPPYALYGGLVFLELTFLAAVHRNAELGAGNEAPNVPLGEYLKWENNILVVFIAGIVQFFVFFILLVVLDVYSTGVSLMDVFPCIKTKKALRPLENPDIPQSEDADVSNERQKVDSILPDGEEKPPIILRNLRKTYKKRKAGFCSCCGNWVAAKTPAVRNVSFAVEEGEVFGLLGPNGAGKTTTLNTILAETAPDKGRVCVGGHDIRSSLSEAYEALGYCPQHDPLWEDVTLEEHIKCYAAIRGVPNENIATLTKFFLESLKLEDHSKKVAKSLSGGTKRKLCYILSMLGNPQVVLLDEPSTGMDPKSKRFLWNTISGMFAGSEKGAILTTHYMDEADVLCSRVGIMVNGLLQCIGSTQHLKGKYGSGYILALKVNASIPTRLEELKGQLHDFVIEHFPHAVLVEGFGNMVTYKILKDDIQSLAKVFAALEDGKSRMSIEEYSFSQSTLEQVFLNFAKNQLILDEDPNIIDLPVTA
ncbi:cholesterol transporter ABCA5-like isoform X2 [Lineus longissimus]